MQYQKVKSVAKQVETKGPDLTNKILSTMKTISDIVGGTLGPGGQPVLIERQEAGLPAFVTKDGVTVFKSLGFDDPSAHCIMESARDASVRTASEAGDGTTTATILSEAIVRNMVAYCAKNPKVSPQKVIRSLEKAFKEEVVPFIRGMSTKAELTGDSKLLFSVAKTSANGDIALAEAVMECYNLVGDDGSVTLMEVSGPSGYEVEKIEGFPLPTGFEDSCSKYYSQFINDQGNQRCVMEKPVFVVYNGKITEIQTVLFLMEEIGRAWQEENFNHNVVIVANGYSESVLANLGMNFSAPSTINVFPMLAPQSPVRNGQLSFLEDICSITGAVLFDPLTNPLDDASLEDLGTGIDLFEAFRFRSTMVGRGNEETILARADQLKQQLANPEGELERRLLQERLGKLVKGIAKLKVIGSSNGELKEKRDRAEDAICAVRGAIKYGVLPGGAKAFLSLIWNLGDNQSSPEVLGVLLPSLEEPFKRLLFNAGYSRDQIESLLEEGIVPRLEDGHRKIFDVAEGKFVNAFDAGILDSTQAVLEALQNSISIASLLGTLGGTVVYKRDLDLEQKEARATASFLRDAEHNPANERG